MSAETNVHYGQEQPDAPFRRELDTIAAQDARRILVGALAFAGAAATQDRPFVAGFDSPEIQQHHNTYPTDHSYATELRVRALADTAFSGGALRQEAVDHFWNPQTTETVITE